MRSSKMLPLALLVGAVVIVFVLFIVRRTPEEHAQRDAAPLVRVAIAEPAPYQFFVTAHGSVSPRTESELIPQVSGEILWVSPSLSAGGFFDVGEPLVRIDSADYRVELESARAVVARATSGHHRAKKELERQRLLADRSVTSQSRIDDSENDFRVAEATLREAEARLERATRDLSRTELAAPYRGRARAKHVDIGEFVARGTPIASLFAVDYAEVRLPLPDRELAFLDVPLVPAMMQTTDEDAIAARGSGVRLSAEFAGQQHHWNGTLVRTEAELDPRSRMVHLVVRVHDPYGLETGPAKSLENEPETRVETGAEATAPLAMGLFVEAEIEGLSVAHAYVIPRDALRKNDQVYVVDDEGRLHFRNVEIIRTERDVVIVGSGLAPGERVCTSPLQAAIDGMSVRIAEQPRDEGLAKHATEPVEALP